ncbi:MAG: guanylate kinase [Paludibacteraceae bacterium]|nr:guanylate kinase [Paludibacteraceae bacterium]
MIIIFSAPSGSGKSTLVNHLLSQRDDLEFSVSATSRPPRGQEQNGVAYYFLTPEEFRKKIENNEFVEFEEVYNNCFYGTLKSEIERIERNGHHVVFDVDVKGGVNLKKIFGDKALALFIAPPSIEELRNRLVNRATDSPEMIDQRVAKAAEELTYANQFDNIIVNDNLDEAKQETENKINAFLK